MAVSVGSYNATLTINEFKGVMQFDENESMNTDVRYANEASNIDTRDGNLMPVVAPTYIAPVRSNQQLIVKSAAYFERKHATRFANLPKEVLVAGVTPIDNPDAHWIYVGPADGSTGGGATIAPEGTSLQSSFWSFAYYEYTPEGETDPVDVILMSNAEDGMYMIRGDTEVPMPVLVSTPYKFGTLARHGERIWGSGIKDFPDLVVYSAPYDPTDWAADPDIPENGAGEVRLPTFDQDYITALKSFGGSLLVFMVNHLWRVSGLTPDEFYFTEQYGSRGTPFPNTICDYQEKLYFLTTDGVYAYDGTTTYPFQDYALRTIWKDANMMEFISAGETGTNGMSIYTPNAVTWDKKYIVNFPGKHMWFNNFTAIYDFKEYAWSYLSGVLDAAAMVKAGEALYILGNQGRTSTRTTLFRWYGSIEAVPEYATPVPRMLNGFDWETPWSDMGCKDVLKNDFKLRFWVQTHVNLREADPVDIYGKLRLEVDLLTERGIKTRVVVFDKDEDGMLALRFHLTGKRVKLRFRLRNGSGNVGLYGWCRIMGGVQLNADTSGD